MSKFKATLVLLITGVIGWIICGVIFYVAEMFFREYLAILIHFILAPFVFVILSTIYFKFFNYTSPVQTALIVTGLVVLLDFFIVAMLIEKNLNMFKSVMGTWLPFLFIFLAILLTGIHYTDKTFGR